MTKVNILRKGVAVFNEDYDDILCIKDVMYDPIAKKERVVQSIDENFIVFEDGFKLNIDNRDIFNVVKRYIYFVDFMPNLKYFKIDDGILYCYGKPVQMGNYVAKDIVTFESAPIIANVILVAYSKIDKKLVIVKYNFIKDVFNIESNFFDDYEKDYESISGYTLIKVKKYYNNKLDTNQLLTLRDANNNFIFKNETDLKYKIDNFNNLKKVNEDDFYKIKNNYMLGFYLYYKGKCVFQNAFAQTTVGDYIIESNSTNICIDNEDENKEIRKNALRIDLGWFTEKEYFYDRNMRKTGPYFLEGSQKKSSFQAFSFFIVDTEPIFDIDHAFSINFKTQKDNEILDVIRINDTKKLNYLIFTKEYLAYVDGAYTTIKIYNKKAIDLIKNKYINFIDYKHSMNEDNFVFASDAYEMLNVKIKKTKDRGYVTLIEEN